MRKWGPIGPHLQQWQADERRACPRGGPSTATAPIGALHLPWHVPGRREGVPKEPPKKVAFGRPLSPRGRAAAELIADQLIEKAMRAGIIDHLHVSNGGHLEHPQARDRPHPPPRPQLAT